ncbi:phytanoyl-CoA dioxygenase family protein [Acetoanaerobium sticklandii]|uniref:phytanoyl-CoA dioxygenase family protein n=1 Tax=Acetoanaerobium sticklandii TaxID=1511 RepID=UPI003A8FCDEC
MKFLYLIHRALFILSGGCWNDLLTFFIRFKKGPQLIDIPSDDIFQNLNTEEINFKNQMNKNGFYIFNNSISKEVLEEIHISIADKDYIETSEHSDKVINYNDFKNSPESCRYNLDDKTILAIPILMKMSASQTLLKLAQSYLRSKPILDIVTLWWSYPSNDIKLHNIAAQMYHFDMDKIKFIKFFVYLTDVNTKNGPHCLFKGSHKHLPLKLRKKGRFSDDEVAKAYGQENEVKITGKAGSIIAVDTRAIHKGDPILEGNRCLFQLQFSNSSFGKFYPKIVAPKLLSYLKSKNISDDHSYQQFCD